MGSGRIFAMPASPFRFVPVVASLAVAGLLASCAGTPPGSEGTMPAGDGNALAMANRVSWGVNPSLMRAVDREGAPAWLQAQLHPHGDEDLPPAIAQRIAGFTVSQQLLPQLAADFERRRREMDATRDDVAKKTAQEAYQRDLTRVAREAAQRSLLRDVYSHHQLQEHMTWFWMNHFSVHQYKANLRLLVGDYEDSAIRPHALGHFRDLVRATLRHPAMIRYLDNEQNAAGRINENYARELLELHTLGVDGGYSQGDVQELARVLTGVGVNFSDNTPKVRDDRRGDYVRDGAFEFNPMRHDYGNRTVLGHAIRGRGLAEVDEVVDVLCRHPATARFVSRKLAAFFVADDPSPALVARMAQRFIDTDGDIAEVLATLFASSEFSASLGHKFKDPAHYVVSAVRFAYDERPILNGNPMVDWLNRLGEGYVNRQTPDGYPMTQAAWASSGQMMTRFEVARSIAGGSAGLFRVDGATADTPAFPRLANALYYSQVEGTLGPATRAALEAAASPQEWGALLLASPEFMHR